MALLIGIATDISMVAVGDLFRENNFQDLFV